MSFVDYLIYAANGIDCIVETERWELLKQEMDSKLRVMKKDLLSQAFCYKLRDMKVKMNQVMNYWSEFVKQG
jgi:hypothetical protein